MYNKIQALHINTRFVYLCAKIYNKFITMKKSNLISIQNFLMAFAIIFTVTCTVGCKKDGCTNQYAENYDSDADNDDGSCTLEREKFIGSYTAIETCGNGTDSYTFTIAQSSAGDNKVIIGNLFDLNSEEGITNSSIPGTIDGSTITIDSELDSASGVVFDGSGTLTDDKLDLSFAVAGVVDPDNCSVNATKQ